MEATTTQGAGTMTETTICQGHNLDHQGVRHVCSDLCTDNECCKGVTSENPERAEWIKAVAR